MDAEYPQSEAEAREHIRHIRREKGLGDGNEQIGHNASDLESALNVLSHDLYQTTTHFLLELIQNADDNSYSKDVTPTLSISHSPGRIRIDCNERGFAKKNIEAICRICKSTKSGRSKSAGFVGEKGIGFKAVFKVASMVWISSGHYSFRFNRDGHLGMIAPIWDTFPDHKHPQGGTSIILELASQCDEPSIIHELSKYDSKVLMFLRRLRRIEISVKQQFWKIGGDFKTTLSRVDKDPRPADRAQMVMLYKNGKKTNYLVWRHMVDKMPPDERRPGITDSEIVLAFPLTASEEPLIETQDVYAFLPVKSIGLNFLVQGDFLLTANREAFHIESSWNKTLVGATISAFVDAVGYMSHLDSNLRYTWLRFVPRDTNPNHSIWNHLQSDITRRLVTTEILETQDGQFRKPANLVYVPNAYRDRTGRPLINYDDRHDMSKKYNIESDPSLFITLGVSYLSISTFQKSVVKHLDGHFSHKRFYKDKDQEWHHDFCKALNTLPKNFWAYESPKLYIIPLSNGKWARPTDGFLFLRPPSKEGILPVPEGLKVRIVDEEAMKDSFRRATCENANIKYLNNDEIRNLILNGHNTEVKGPKNFDPTALAAKALVSHAVFLFNINSTSASTGKIYMAGDMGDCRRGKNMYFQSDLSGSARKVLVPGPQKTYGFLHSSYQNAVERERYGEWFEFLSSQLSVATFPRIWSVDEQDEYTLDTRKKKIHKDFAGLLKSQATIEWLVILRDGWEESTKNPQRPNTQGTYNHSISTFGEHFRSFPVPRKGRLAPIKLGEGFQPTPRLVKKYGTLAPLIELPDPNHRNWGPLLDALGIPDKETAGFYAECLRSARDAVDQVPMDMIRELMSGMDVIKGQDNPPANRRTMSRVDVERIARTKGTTFFHFFNKPEDPLICIPPKEKGGKRKWVSAQVCYWTGEPWLSDLHCLSTIYPQFQIFFCYHVQVPNITSWHFIDELSKVKDWSKHSTARIERLLLGLVNYHTKTTLDRTQISRLRDRVCWPICLSARNEPFSYWTSANGGASWLIADRAFFRDQFDGVLPVLAFSSDMIYRLMPLFEAAGLQERMLSRVASNIIEAGGDATLHEALTKKYRDRTSYLVRLMPDLQHDRDHVRDKFGNVEVYLASSIEQYWTAPLGVKEVRSKVSEGYAFLESDYAGDLRIYLKTGYDAEPFPIELADRLTEFFNIPETKKDLVNVVLTASVDRLDRLFDEKGIPPLLEEIPERPEADFEDPPEDVALARSQTSREEKPKSKLGSSENSRFTRLLAHKRFNSSTSGFSDINQSISSLPSYNTAIGNPSKLGSSSKLDEKKQKSIVPVFYTLEDVEKTLKDMRFQQHKGIVKAKLPEPQGLLERVKNYVQRDNDAAELVVCDVLCSILGQKPTEIFLPRSNRNAHPAFTFVDSHGKFGSFMQRLEETPGRGQGYNRFSYVVDARATSKSQDGRWQFTMAQKELDRFRRYSTRVPNSYSEGSGESREVAVLVVVANPRKEPKMLFVADPWDLYNDGKLLVTASSQGMYTASLRMDIFDNKGKGKATESGFDAVQLRPHEKATWIPAPPPFKPENPEMTEKQLDDDSDDDFTVRSVSPLSR